MRGRCGWLRMNESMKEKIKEGMKGGEGGQKRMDDGED